MTNTEDERAELERLRLRVAELEREVARLTGQPTPSGGSTPILGMCASCKRLRDGPDVWTPLETFLSARLGVDLSHSLCPTCAPEYGFADD